LRVCFIFIAGFFSLHFWNGTAYIVYRVAIMMGKKMGKGICKHAFFSLTPETSSSFPRQFCVDAN